MAEFFRLSGGGNDFLALTEPERPPSSDEIRRWCTRGLSLGADGLFVLRRDAGTVGMDYFNGDGHAADLCLNGTRCAARLAFHLGWAEDHAEIVTGAGPIRAEPAGESRIRLHLPALEQPPRVTSLLLDDEVIEGFSLPVGVPHFVLPWPGGMDKAPVAERGPALRRHEVFGSAGTNVNWVDYVAADRLEIRTFERGVEAETLACGTGAIAAAAVGLLIRRVSLPLRVLTRGGFELEVDGEIPTLEGGRRTSPRIWSLAGDARILAQGRLTDEASALPQPPAW